MTDYSLRLDALFQLEFFGMKLGLENIYSLLSYLGNPEKKFPAIHVAGTNGKGSVASMLASVHQVAGKRTGLYTSPHLVDFRERIRIDGEMISEDAVAHFLERTWPRVEELNATFFEVTTAMALDHYASNHVDIAVIETGLGGRLDATNVLENPLATVITSIGYDHMAQLGATLEEIASEKAGIFKSASPAIVNCLPGLEHVFEAKAREVGTSITFVRHASPKYFGTIEPPFAGHHQHDNVKTVLTTLDRLPARLPKSVIEQGIAETASRTGLRGRLEEFRSDQTTERGVRVLLDVGHNEDALREIRQYFETEGIRPIVVFGIMRDKDVRAALQTISQIASQFIAVHASTPRALPSVELHEVATNMGISSTPGGNVSEGTAQVLSHCKAGDTILIGGSHYVVGEFLKNFQERGRVY